MEEDPHTEKTKSLGEYLRRYRNEKNLSLEDIQQQTRIPVKTLQAMEEDNYSALPAAAFARGFYALYAKCLMLDPQEILKRYDRMLGSIPASPKTAVSSKHEKHVDTMAARPSMAAGSALGFSLVVVIAAVSFFSWYFSWNPATYVSEIIQSYQDSTTPEAQNSEKVQSGESVLDTHDGTNYFLTIDFLEDSSITISIDGGPPTTEVYSGGSTRSWYADKHISLILPETADTELVFNGSEVPLPEAQNGIITLSLP
ncbi:MAG: helix-turn-helix domain-containing protein [Desulfopila sp.]|jgi:cytoskeletal protein RodZ|nr:helix-turn-helix domain-containing protein [Desulfopila sp.]